MKKPVPRTHPNCQWIATPSAAKIDILLQNTCDAHRISIHATNPFPNYPSRGLGEYIFLLSMSAKRLVWLCLMSLFFGPFGPPKINTQRDPNHWSRRVGEISSTSVGCFVQAFIHTSTPWQTAQRHRIERSHHRANLGRFDQSHFFLPSEDHLIS